MDNESIHLHAFSSDQLSRLFTKSFSESIRFFSYFTFALNFYFGKLNIFGYHLVNLIIHFSTGIFLFWFILLTLNLPSQREKYGAIGFKVAFFTSLLFIVHPVQTQAVTYVVQRMTSMAAMFYLLSMILFIKGRLSTGKRQLLFYGGMGISGLLSTFSKESAFVLPIFIAFYEILFFKQWEKKSINRSTVKVLLVVGGLGLIGFLLLGGKYVDLIQEGYRYRDFTMSERMLTQLRVVLHYLTLLAFPHPSRLNLDYDFRISSSLFNPPTTFFSLILIISFIGMGIWRMKKWPVFSFFIFWYFGNLLIESSIIPLEMVYEHRLYLPSIGPIFLFSLLWVKGWERWAPAESRKREPIFWGLLLLIILPLSWSTVERNSIWRSEFELWTDCVKKSPLKGRPHYNLGYYYYHHGQTEKAVGEFELALRLDPRMAPAHFNIGVIYFNKGLLDDAQQHFKKAIDLYPQYAQAYIHLGEIYEQMGRREEARIEFEKAFKIDPRNVLGAYRMGVIYLERGDLDKAVKALERVLKIDPNHVRARVALAESHTKMGRLDQALSEIKKAQRLDPVDGEAFTILGIIYLQKGIFDEAISALKSALEITPDDTVALNNLGVAYRFKGMMDEAILQFKKILSSKPNDEDALVNLGEAYLQKDKLEEAIKEIKRALQINPQSIPARLHLGAAYFKRGLIDQAIDEWKRVINMNPKEAKAHHNLAAAYYARREFRLAIKHLDEAANLGFNVHPQLVEWLKPYR